MTPSRAASALAFAALILVAGCGGSSSGGGVSGGGGGGGNTTPITPDAAPASDLAVTIDSGADVRPISRFIYGKNFVDWTGASGAANFTLDRVGGNRYTAYNWETNASNAGTDWYNSNDGYLGGGTTPGEAIRPGIAAAHAHGAAMIITVPINGYVAADKNGNVVPANEPGYLANRFRVSQAAKGAALSLTPDASDAFVYQDEFVNWVEHTFPLARTDPARTIFYCLDNEPDLWSSTHPVIHPNPVRYDELAQKSAEYAAAIKAVAPTALVFGPVNYGWQGMVNLQSAPDAAGRDFLDFYLAQMKAAGQASGKRLLDVLDFHWYSEAYGNNAAGVSTRITDDNADPGVAAARIQAPRSLWDPAYAENSWIANFSTNGPIKLLPRVQAKIDAQYPGTRIAVTEYFYGGGNHISGGIAQADALGIFGRQGVFAATLWPLSANLNYIYGGFRMFRNVNGANGAFGDTAIRAVASDVANGSAYASVDQGNPERMVIVLINKSAAARTAGIRVTHIRRFLSAAVYQLTAASPDPQRQANLPITLVNAFQYTMPAMSVTTLVLDTSPNANG